MMIAEATIRKIFLRVKPPASDTSDHESHNHMRMRSMSPAILTTFIIFSHL